MGSLIIAVLLLAGPQAEAPTADGTGEPLFRQLEEILPTANTYRTASGAPGEDYWQQRADYVIDVTVDDQAQRIDGSERVTYYNRSPDTLRYLWMQLDPNLLRQDADSITTTVAPDFEKFTFEQLDDLLERDRFEGGLDRLEVVSEQGDAISHTVVKTMVRIDLEQPLEPGKTVTFHVRWGYPIPDARKVKWRTGYEYFEKDKNYIYEIAQFYPRMAAYTDYQGWQNKQYLGDGEFTVEFGDYVLNITAPADHVVGATGVLTNAEVVLTNQQRERLAEAATAKQPVFIVTPNEAKRAQGRRSRETKTWRFEAKNVRDVAFATSRKFIWDAQGIAIGDRTVMAMSLYPNEAEALWSRYSTAAIRHTIDVYSRYTFDYPYPVCWSVNGAIGGMEYPMLSFNAPRPYEDGTYWDKTDPYYAHPADVVPWENTKYGLISVIIHEVGHNYFPMVVNSDERQWTWMDEGMNTFMQFIAEQAWEEGYPSRRGYPRDIAPYMSSPDQVPVMSNSEHIVQFGNNAYGKPATALNVLRETVLGRELFDFAFKEYARRWMFKRPLPADFFRTMEDASGIDLDWFWRGWFYSTDHVDIALTKVTRMELETLDPLIDKPRKKAADSEKPVSLTDQRNAGTPRLIDRDPRLRDYYNNYDPYAVTRSDRERMEEYLAGLTEDEKRLLQTERNFYALQFDNLGGVVMPLVLALEYTDGTREEMRVPAEVWRINAETVTKLLMTEKTLQSVALDPHDETADADRSNNDWPRSETKEFFRLHKDPEREPNPMRDSSGS